MIRALTSLISQAESGGMRVHGRLEVHNPNGVVGYGAVILEVDGTGMCVYPKDDATKTMRFYPWATIRCFTPRGEVPCK